MTALRVPAHAQVLNDGMEVASQAQLTKLADTIKAFLAATKPE